MNVACVVSITIGLILSGLVSAQDVRAGMRPTVEKFKTDEAALTTLRDDAIAKARQKYEAALSTAETAALNAGQLNVVAAVTRERQAIQNNAPTAAAPADLPKSLLTARKAFTDAIASISGEIASRRHKLTVEYVRSLSALQATSDPALATAIANEKLRVLSEIQAQTASVPAVPPKGSIPSSTFSGLAKPLKDYVEVVPWIDKEFREVKFKARERRIPDELNGRIDGSKIIISGEKKTSTGKFDGQLIAHWGKLALISAPAPQSGTVVVDEPWGEDGAKYGIALELTSGKLKTLMGKLQLKVTYDWAYSVEDKTCRLSITKNGGVVYEVAAPAADVKAFGFCSTVRYPKDKAEITVTVNPSPQIK